MTISLVGQCSILTTRTKACRLPYGPLVYKAAVSIQLCNDQPKIVRRQAPHSDNLLQEIKRISMETKVCKIPNFRAPILTAILQLVIKNIFNHSKKRARDYKCIRPLQRITQQVLVIQKTEAQTPNGIHKWIIKNTSYAKHYILACFTYLQIVPQYNI